MRGVRPRYADIDALIEPQLENPPAADRDVVVRLYLLRMRALTGISTMVYPAELEGINNRVKRTERAVADAEKAVDLTAGLPKSLVTEAHGALGMAYLFDGLAKKKPDGSRAMLEQLEKSQKSLAEALQAAPNHEHAYQWKFGYGFYVLEKVNAEVDYKNVPQLCLGFSLMLEAKADLFGARPESDRANASRTVETNLKAWTTALNDLPGDAGKDLVQLRELLDRHS